MKSFLNSINFLTIIKIPKRFYLEKENFNKTLYYFPLVGLLIGLMIFIFCFFLSFFLPKIIIVVLILGFEVLITGAMHLDGLSDTIDGVFSGETQKDKILEIMKKSDIGVFGVLSLIFLFLIKFALIFYLMSLVGHVNYDTIYSTPNSYQFNDIRLSSTLDPLAFKNIGFMPINNLFITLNLLLVILFMPAFSRWTINYQFCKYGLDFKKEDKSLTNIFVGKENRKSYYIASIYLFAFFTIFLSLSGFFLKDSFILNNYSWLLQYIKNNFENYGVYSKLFFLIIPFLKSILAILIFYFITKILSKFFLKKIGRLSGDAIGALVEISEIVYIFIICLMIFAI